MDSPYSVAANRRAPRYSSVPAKKSRIALLTVIHVAFQKSQVPGIGDLHGNGPSGMASPTSWPRAGRVITSSAKPMTSTSLGIDRYAGRRFSNGATPVALANRGCA